MKTHVHHLQKTSAKNFPHFFLEFLMLLFVVFAGCRSNEHCKNSDALAGLYRLHSIETKDSSGAWHPENITISGDGYILYDGNGHMAVQLVGKGYKDFHWLNEAQALNPDTLKKKIDSMAGDELRAALTEFTANFVYVANYHINDSSHIVQHDRLSNTIPSAWNTTVQRKFSFAGDTLILEPVNANRRLKWVRQIQSSNQ